MTDQVLTQKDLDLLGDTGAQEEKAADSSNGADKGAEGADKSAEKGAEKGSEKPAAAAFRAAVTSTSVAW